MSSGADKGWHRVCEAHAVRDDEALAVKVGERDIAVCRVRGRLYAIDNICSHEFACMSDGLIEDEEIECPLHQARFHIPTGKVLSEPATVDLETFEVREDGGAVFVKVSRE